MIKNKYDYLAGIIEDVSYDDWINEFSDQDLADLREQFYTGNKEDF